MAAKLKKGDKVIVLSGKDKGKQGEISSVNPSLGKAVVDGVNMAIRHTKQTQADQGGRIPRAVPIQLSNLALVDSKGKATSCLLYTSPSPRDATLSRMPSSA